MPDPTAEHKLARIRQAVTDLGRVAWEAARDVFPAEVYEFLGRAAAILEIPEEEYRP